MPRNNHTETQHPSLICSPQEQLMQAWYFNTKKACRLNSFAYFCNQHRTVTLLAPFQFAGFPLNCGSIDNILYESQNDCIP